MVPLALQQTTAADGGQDETLVKRGPDFEGGLRHGFRQERSQFVAPALKLGVWSWKSGADLSSRQGQGY